MYAAEGFARRLRGQPQRVIFRYAVGFCVMQTFDHIDAFPAGVQTAVGVLCGFAVLRRTGL